MTKRRSFSQIILFSKTKFTVIYNCMNFIDFYQFKHSILGDNSYYPIKFNIFLYIIPYNTIIFNQNQQNFIISKTIVFSLFKNMICRILICLTAKKFASKVATPVLKKQRLNAFFQYTCYEHRKFADLLLDKTYIIVLNDIICLT